MNLINLIPLMLMDSYDETCGGIASESDVVVANKGINEVQAYGALRHLFWTSEDFEIASFSAAKNAAVYNTAVEENKLVYLGRVITENGGDDEERFTVPGLKIDVQVNKGTKTLVCTSANCAHVNKELLKLNGRNGRVIGFTDLDLIKGRGSEGKFIGRPASISFGKFDEGTDDSPYDPTVFTLNFTDFDGDDRNKAIVVANFEPEDIAQITPLQGILFGDPSSDGSTLTFKVDILEDAQNTPKTDLVLASFKATDLSGTALTIASVQHAAGGDPNGRYTIDINTTGDNAQLTTAGTPPILNINGDLFYLNVVTAQVPS